MTNLPSIINRHIGAETPKADTIGRSNAGVYLYDNFVLKVQPSSDESRAEHDALVWLNGKVPVPRVIEYTRDGEYDYLLMGYAEGEIACGDIMYENPDEVTRLLAEGMKMLWAVDISDCPLVNDLDVKLAVARHNIDNNLVDLGNVTSGTFGENGFENPDALYDWLVQNRLNEDIVLSHGDYCLPNIFINNGEVTGFIDLGKTGRACRWEDIAICYRSLKNNLSGIYGGEKIDYDAERLFDYLGIEPDWDKINYYILLDELF